MRIVAISGSLRKDSSNSVLVRAIRALAPCEVRIYEGLAELPHFNPELEESEGAPASVQAWRVEIAAADAVVICAPEYAHGVPGSLKNGLDWLVGSGEFVEKPVGLVNASPRAVHAQASLAEILATMSARVIPAASITVPFTDRKLDEGGIISDEAMSRMLKDALTALLAAAAGAAAHRAGDPGRGLPRGTSGRADLIVRDADLASALGASAAEKFPPVFATARMIALMERAAAVALGPLLNPGELSVGVDIHVAHTAATLPGSRVEAVATFTGMDEKLFMFDVVASDEGGVVGKGSHRRAIVQVDRLLAGAQKRRG